MSDVALAVIARSSIIPDPARLSDLERSDLATIRGERRRDEWIRGRLAIRQVIGDPEASIVVEADGSPRSVGGAPRSVSLSHDGEWFAVAVAKEGARLGVDLCVRDHAVRVTRILAWLGVATACDPVVAWASLEVVLKLRRLSVEALRDCTLAVDEVALDRIAVRGLGDPVTVAVRHAPAYVVAWATA